MMKTFKYLFVCVLLFAANVGNASIITGHFSQDGFDGGGSISGYFRGEDTDGDGQIRSIGGFSTFLDQFLGLNKSLAPINELLYAEITYSGFGTTQGDHTVVFNGNIDSFPFFSLVYNIGSGKIGDEANEGLSFSTFAPSTNYVLGELFDFLILPDIDLTTPVTNTWGSCNGINTCGAVVEFIPGAAPMSIETVFQSLSKSSVNVVPEPSLKSFFILALVGMFLKSRDKLR